MQSSSILLLLLLCGTAAAVTLGASAQASGSGVPQTQQQCVINKRKIMATARRYYKAQYETKLLLLKLRVRRQQLLEKRRRYQTFLQRMRLRHKARIHRRIRRFKRRAKKVRNAYRRKLRYVTKRFQRKVMRKIKVKPLSTRRIRLINRVFFKNGIISKRAAKIARKPVKITPMRFVNKHLKRKTPRFVKHYSKKAQIKRLKVRRLMTKTQLLVRAQIKHQVKKLRLNKCCRGRGKRHILRRRIQTLTRLLLNHIRRDRQRRMVQHSRRTIGRKLRKITRRAKRSRRRAIRKLRRIHRTIRRTQRNRRSRRVIQRLLVQRRRIIKRIVSRKRLIRRIAKKRRQVIRRFVRMRIRGHAGRGRRSRRIRRRHRVRHVARRQSRRRQRVTKRRRHRVRRVDRRQSMRRQRVTRRRHHRVRRVARRSRRRQRVSRRRRHRSSRRTRRIAKKVIKRAHRMAVKVKRTLRKILTKRRKLVRIRRRRVALKRRVSRMLVKKHSLKRRIAAVRARRTRLIIRMRLLRLRRAKISGAKKVTLKHQPKKVSKKVSVKRTTKLAKRTVRRTVRINKRLRRLASRVTRCSMTVHRLKRRRVIVKKRIFKFSARHRRLRQRIVVMRKKSHRQVRRLRKLIVLKRRYIKRVITRRLVSRKTIRRIVKHDRRVIRRTVRRRRIHKRRRPARSQRRVTRRRKHLRVTKSHGLRRLVRRSAIILKTKRVFISGTKVVVPRLVTATKHHVPGMKRKEVMLRRLNKKLHYEKRKVILRLNTRSAIRKIVRPHRVRLAIRASVKKVLGGKKLLRVTKMEAIAKKILLSRKPSRVRNLKMVQANLRRKLVQLKRKLATATPALKNLIQQKKAAYASAEDEVKSGFSHTITESKEVYGKIINRQKWLYNTEYETLVSEEYKTSDEEIDPKTKKWIVKFTTTVWSHFSVGCFKDAANRDLKLLAETSGSMSLSHCRDLCKGRGFPFFGVQNGNECRCGSSYGSHGVAQASSCSSPCSGDKAQMCGGAWRNSVYSTGLSGYKLLNVGCFHDKSDRDLPKLAVTSDGMSLRMCTKLCGNLGYKYFGVQNSKECWCGNTYGKHGPARSHKCNMPCRGDKGNMCGGAWLNSVYKTGLAEGGSVTHEIAQHIANDKSGDSSKWTETSSTSEVVGAPAITTTSVTSEDKAGPVTTHGTQHAVKTVNPDGSISWTESSETHVVDAPTVTVTKSEPVESTHTVVESGTK